MDEHGGKNVDEHGEKTVDEYGERVSGTSLASVEHQLRVPLFHSTRPASSCRCFRNSVGNENKGVAAGPKTKSVK